MLFTCQTRVHGPSLRAGAAVGAHACAVLLDGKSLWQLALISSGAGPRGAAAPDPDGDTAATQQRAAAAAVASAVLLRAVSDPAYGLWDLPRGSSGQGLQMLPVRHACVSPHQVAPTPSCPSSVTTGTSGAYLQPC